MRELLILMAFLIGVTLVRNLLDRGRREAFSGRRVYAFVLEMLRADGDLQVRDIASQAVFARRYFRRSNIVLAATTLGIAVVVTGVLPGPRIVAATAIALISTVVPVLIARSLLQLSGYESPASLVSSGKALVGLGATASGGLIVVGVMVGWAALDRTGSTGTLLEAAVLATVAVVAIFAADLPVDLTVRLAAKRSHADFDEDSLPDAILLLRSFNDDRLTILSAYTGRGLTGLLGGRRMRFEEYVALAALADGPLVAIGRPGESLPPLGATRTYAADEKWQGLVDAAARRAKAIVMIAGSSQGVSWEVGHLSARGLLDKTLFIIPPVNAEQTEARIRQLSQDLGLEYMSHPPLPTITAVRLRSGATPTVYSVLGRDDAGYMVTIRAFLDELSGARPASTVTNQSPPPIYSTPPPRRRPPNPFQPPPPTATGLP